jgi:hypothetical protein
MVEIGHQSAQKFKAHELQKARFDMIEDLHAQGFVGVSGETFEGFGRKLITQNLYVVHPSHIRYLQEAEDTISEQKARIKELESVLCETCKDPACEDSVIEHLKQKIARLENENARMRLLLSDCLDCFEDTPTRPIVGSIKNALGGVE